jgi:hypothetical protein
MKLAHGAPDDTHVRDGDSAYFGASLGVPIPMDPGKHSLIVDAPGHEAQTIEIALVEGAQQLVEVAPGPEKPPPSSSSVPANALAPDSRLRSPRHDAKTVGFVIGGAGVLGLGVGAVAGMMALGKQRAAEDGCDYVRRTCTQQGIDAASAGHTLAVVSTVGWIAGAVGVGAGTYFVLTSSRARPETALAAEMRPGGVTVSLRRRF